MRIARFYILTWKIKHSITGYQIFASAETAAPRQRTPLSPTGPPPAGGPTENQTLAAAGVLH
jgi:hypothetical protein